jgi:uncharacterized protein YecE (DUF72 family)
VRLHVGTSGWQYDWWRVAFYPRAMPRRQWLAHYAGCFATVEVNNAFYRLPERATFERWAATVPDDFTFALKASRFLTHVKRLADPAESVARMLDRARGLGHQLGPVLLQLPPQLAIALDRLDGTLAQFPEGQRVAVEFRHPSWFVDECRSVLERRGAALCLVDRRGPRAPMWRTADWGYVRFHEGRGRSGPDYGRASLTGWVGRLAELWPEADAEVHAYFNNDADACAVRDAHRLALAARRSGIPASRTPALRRVPART